MPMVTWGDGHMTAAPFISDGKGGNKLYDDEYYARRIGTAKEVGPKGSDMVAVLDFEDKDEDDVRDRVARALSQGRCVMIQNVRNFHDFDLTPETLHKSFGLPPGMPVDVQGEWHTLYSTVCPTCSADVENRGENGSETIPLQQFFDTIKDERKINYVPSLPLQQHAFLEPFK